VRTFRSLTKAIRFMTKLLPTLLLICFACTCGRAQTRVNPVVPSYGGIYPIEVATFKPDSSLRYKIVVDVVSGAEEPDVPGFGLNNVARMLNLHAVGGVPAANMEVVLAIHGGATVNVLNDEAYRAKYEVVNPNLPLIRELKAAGVRLTVCGQSLIARKIDLTDVAPEVEIATSMLTTVSTCQLKGYAVFRF